ncbi:Matrix metalloproteinase-24 [Toxocara canis]|uniref:Matrix metalloproteinase-24 n=1 Tax=Toxocara canis TaxID=6265 RepID=A0A0B2VEY0_TOXCA|nr:Matrix metalloproteinase-24 [Toxocara canis]
MEGPNAPGECGDMAVLRRQLHSFIVLLLLVPSFYCKRHLKPVSDAEATKYLSNYGYVSTSNVLQSAPRSEVGLDREELFSSLKTAIRKFQEFAGLRQTGELDDTTKRKMAEPRCGVTDVLAITSGRGAAFKWNKNDLTYSIESYSLDLPQDDIRLSLTFVYFVLRAMAQAFNMWSQVTPLNFKQVPTRGDIRIRFATRSHGDPWPFDGTGRVLAHATMPPTGMLHFDDDENWVYMDPKKISEYDYMDLLAVAVHESGHTLGLEHSRDESSIMAPFYQETVDAHGNYKMPKLNSDDITKIQDIYGPRRGALPNNDDVDSGPPRRSSPGDSGRGSSRGGGGLFDRIKSFFGFGDSHSSSADRNRGDSNANSHSSVPVDPGSFSSGSGSFFHSGSADSGRDSDSSFDSTECPKDADGVTTIDGITYLFSGSKVYEISGERVGKVHSLKQLFPNSPAYVQGVLTVPYSGVILLFQHRQVYAYTRDRLRGNFRLDSRYPKRLPSDVTFNPMGAFVWIDGREVLVNAPDEEHFRTTMMSTPDRQGDLHPVIREEGGGGLFDRIKSFFGFGDSHSSSADRNRGDSNANSHSSVPVDPGSFSSGSGSFFHSGSADSGRDSDSSFDSTECPKDADGVTTIDGITYLFSGSKVYEISGERVGKVHSLKQLFPNSPAYVQGVLTVPYSGVILLFQHRQVYAYTRDRLRGNFRLDSRYPKRLPSDVTFNPMGAFVWIDGREVLVNAHDFAIYDDNWNKVTLQNKLSNYFDNLPNEPLRGAVINGNLVTFFANDNVYKYDVKKRHVIGGAIPLRSYLHC